MSIRGLPIPARLAVVSACCGLIPLVQPARGEPGPASATMTQPATEQALVTDGDGLRPMYVLPRPAAPQPASAIPPRARRADTEETADLPPDGDRRILIEPVVPPSSPIYHVPHYRSRARLPRHQRDWADYRYFGGQPSRHGYGMYRRYSDAGSYGHGYGYGGDDEFFRFGFLKGYDRGRFEATSDERVQRVLAHASIQLDRGLALFQQGDYPAAVDAFRLATEADHGDAAARIYAGHALFAVGRYRDGVQFLRRAFQLQPRITYLSYDIRNDYGDPADFDRQLDDLRKALALSPQDPDRLFMLGYVLYYTGQRGEAHRVLAQATRVDAKDEIARRLMQNAQPPDVELDGR